MNMNFFCSLFIASAALASEPPYPLEDYLNEVKGKHAGYSGAKAIATGAQLRAAEAELLLAPTLFGDAKYDYDERPTITPAFQGTKTISENYSFGVSKLTTFGLNSRLYYSLTRTRIFGANPAFLPLSDYFIAHPALEITQSLWRNFGGAETQAEQELREAQARALSYEQGFRLKQILADAEAAYWRLAFTQARVAVEEESLKRAAAIRDWLSKQVKMQLSDRSDLLQALAAVNIRELDLASARDEERSAALQFNSLRGAEETAVREKLVLLDDSHFDRLSAPKRGKERREDVRAAEQQARAASATAKMGLQRESPTLEAYGMASLNGQDAGLGESFHQASATDHPYYTAGIRFSAPLDLGTIFAAREGYARELKGAEQGYQRAKFEEEREWDDLSRKFDEAKKRLTLSRAIVSTQKDKAEHERERHRRGRTTTYQVLTFEQDYAAARLAQLRAQNEVLSVLTRMKTFGGAP